MKMPISTNPPPSNPHQRGAALLIAMLIVVLGLVTLLTFRSDRKAPEMEAQRKTALALAQAKETLLGRAALDNGGISNPGRLPCPDRINNGDAPGNACVNSTLNPNPNLVGRVPWRTLAMGDIRDEASERLWYIVDNNFGSASAAMNTTIQPTLTFNGQPIVAAIIAPGITLSALAQNRSTSGSPPPSNIYTNYLESYDPVTNRLTSVPPPAISTTEFWLLRHKSFLRWLLSAWRGNYHSPHTPER